MIKKIHVFLLTLVLVAAVSCQFSDEDKENAAENATIEQDVSKMVELSLVADYGEEGSDLADAYFLGNGRETELGGTQCAAPHFRHRPKFGPFHNIVIDTAWTYIGCDNIEQDAYDPSTTSMVKLESDSSGTLTLRRMTKTFSRHAEISVSGLCGDNEDFTVNGNASSKSQMTFTASKNETVRNYSVETTANLTDIVISANWMTNPYPLSGTITCFMVIDKTSDGDPTTVIIHVEKKVVITFNGTATPEIVIN